MNKDIKARLTELKKIIRIPKEILGLSEAYLTNEAVKLLMDAMVSEGLDELILVACDPNGNPLDGWDCDEDFKFDANDIVNFSHNEIIVTPKIKYYNDIAFGVLTRFGINNEELMYHTTNVVIHKDGDLSYGDTEKENWQEDWLPVSSIEDQTKIRKLIFKCLSSKCEGIWRFTKEHPECCFLHRVLDNDILSSVIAANNGSKDLSWLFGGYKHLRDIDLSELNTSQTTSLQGLFYHCNRLKRVDFSKSNTNRCVTFESLLDGCSSLTEACFGGKFSTCSETSFKEMFRDCSSLTSLNLSSFDTLKVRDLNMMFYGCSSLVTLDLNNWDLNNRQTYSDMFSSCVHLTKLWLLYSSPTRRERG